MTKITNKILQLLKTMANDPNNLKRGIHRVGIVTGAVLFCAWSIFVGYLLIMLVFVFHGNYSDIGVDPIFIVLLGLFCMTPIVLAKALGWIIEGFQKTKD